MKIAVVIAAYNEHAHIGDVVRGVLKAGYKNVIVANDGSKDGTGALAEQAGATVVRHIVNLGKGAAMKTGADFAFKHGADAVIFLDADGQHKPSELPKFEQALSEGYDIVFGFRRRTKNMPLMMRFGNWFLSALIRVLYRMDLHDSQCGYRALTMNAYKKIRWESRDYSVESEIIAYAGKHNLRYTEFEIETIYHDHYKGTTLLDGFPVLWNLLWWRFFN